MCSVLYTLILSTVVFCTETTTVNGEMYTDCSGWTQCITSLANIERLQIEYLTAVHDKDKYNKLCPSNENTLFFCTYWLSYDCNLHEVINGAKQIFTEYRNLCNEYAEQWKKKDAATVLMQSDLGCKEIINCFKDVYDTYGIYFGEFGALRNGDIRYSKFCSYSEKLNSCWANSITRCEMTSVNRWLKKLHHNYVRFCLNNDTIVSDLTLDTITTKRCQRDKCWNNLQEIKLKDMQNFYFSTVKVKREEICKKILQFRECNDPYVDICSSSHSTDRMIITERLLNQTFCSEQTKIAVENAEYNIVTNCTGLAECLKPIAERERNALKYMSEIYNKSNYDKICNNKDRDIYSCIHNMMKTCFIHQLNDWVTNQHKIMHDYCYNVDGDWGIKVPVSLLNEGDIESCLEPFKCLKELAENENIAAGYVDMIMDTTKYTNLCSNSEKVKVCLNKSQNNTCRVQSGAEWLQYWKKLIEVYCEDTIINDISTVWKIIDSSACLKETCWNLMDKISRDTLENFELTESPNQFIKKNTCNIRDSFKDCIKEYSVCNGRVTPDQFTKSSLIDYIFCSDKETEDKSNLF